ncbi:hypothetical protein RD792_016523 [Penstemon davidsonii]|uniref:ABC transporter domain-containing protein n=1 Tax=Penstemon davidsonii TaxID=160366 RepID=A0ABR0CK19_9LAMI|nr:hypothetical protein RD792_016523 [Penstemon davidsonii]
MHKCSFGLIFGRSGSGKTTLLQLIAGLSKPTSGSIYIQKYNDDGRPYNSPELLNPGKVGIVFQFPERYLHHILFIFCFYLKYFHTHNPDQSFPACKLIGWSNWNLFGKRPTISEWWIQTPACPSNSVSEILTFLDVAQYVQTPDLLILDEPLAGLDWKARADVVKLLKDLKKELSLLVVSHDLK